MDEAGTRVGSPPALILFNKSDAVNPSKMSVLGPDSGLISMSGRQDDSVRQGHLQVMAYSGGTESQGGIQGRNQSLVQVIIDELRQERVH